MILCWVGEVRGIYGSYSFCGQYLLMVDVHSIGFWYTSTMLEIEQFGRLRQKNMRNVDVLSIRFVNIIYLIMPDIYSVDPGITQRLPGPKINDPNP